ncbi:MAG: YfcE family phosphodiesterase [Dehalococcoidia bacterium]|nr:YfcE family phosphodiesterase [Dehalococcoidia bacterium]
MRIALISDTHLPSLIRTPAELGPELGDFLAGADLILHGGDVVRPSVLDWCEQYAQVVVSTGNNDAFEDPRMLPIQFLEIAGWRIAMLHDLRPEDRPVREMIDRSLGGREVDIIIAGDTHLERLEYRDDVLIINSGSPTLPHHKETRLGTVGWLELDPGRIHAEIRTLGQTNGSPNPGTPRHLLIEEKRLVAHSLNGEALPLPVTDAAD